MQRAMDETDRRQEKNKTAYNIETWHLSTQYV